MLGAYGPRPGGMDAPDGAGPSKAMSHALAPLLASAFFSVGLLSDKASLVAVFFPSWRMLSARHQTAFRKDSIVHRAMDGRHFGAETSKPLRQFHKHSSRTMCGAQIKSIKGSKLTRHAGLPFVGAALLVTDLTAPSSLLTVFF